MTVVAVVLVHGRNVGQPLAFDDFLWLDDHPSSLGDVLRTLTPPAGAGIYRPLLDLWFDVTNALFGPPAVPLHLFGLGAAVALALAVRWMCLELGLTRVAATVAGIFAGTNGALVIASMWSAATPSLAMGACAATAVALVQRPGRNRRLAAAALLLVAILWRDSAVTVPAMATLFVLARPDRDRGWHDLSGALRSTASLWVVSLAYVSVRIARGLLTAPSDDGYRSELGTHMLGNLSTILRYTGQFGMYRRSGVLEGVLMAVLVIGFWGALVGGAVLALRRRNFLPAAGLVAFGVGILPFLGLTNHAMETYYVEAAILGLSVSVGALVDWISPRTVVVVVGTVVFVAGMAFAAKVVDDRHWIKRYEARAEVLADTAGAHPITDGILVVEEACAADADVTRDGALFRVVLGRPDLRVRFRVLEPGSRPTTPWGCRYRPADAAR
ncbi:MAG: hypothetical protein ACKOVH_01390 [Actinomycetota bacterium]